MADDKPIIIIKKKGGHGGHHGGAWKVAYADFVTAMMAFFMVMWLVNSAESKTKKAIASFFRRPGLFESGSGTPLLIGGAGILPDAYAPPKPYEDTNPTAGSDTASSSSSKGQKGDKKGPFESPQTDQDLKALGIVKSDEMLQGVDVEKAKKGGAVEFVEKLTAQKKKLEELAKSLEKQMNEIPEFKELLGLIEITFDADGLTIEIMDTDKASMFRSGSAQIMPESAGAFEKIAGLLKTLPNKIDIMGHTDGKPFSSRGGMSNWELSADRANAARRLLEQQGIPPEQITSVVGRADRDLRFAEEPFNPSNRRISLKVKFDLEKIKSSPESEKAFDDFNKFFPHPTPEQPVRKEETVQASELAEPRTVSIAPDGSKHPTAPARATVDGQTSYKPQIELRGKEQKTTIELPPENGKGKGGQPTIFGENPVMGPANPFFGN